ncbi:MAG: hypothetical protein L6461_24035 [Anaerolineae bacterium]|nr:hypothetical protein [Anaerolineae bacterium]
MTLAHRLNAEEIQARQTTGASRPLREHEAVRLLLMALGAFNRQASVLTMNIRLQGKPAALTIIPGTRFTPDKNGKTTLRKVDPQ